MNVALYSSILTVIGLIIGAILQYRFNQAIEIRRQANQARTECYVDYIRCVARYAAQSRDAGEAAVWRAQALEARVRICIYGTHEVIRALARFEWNEDPVMSDAYVDHILNILVAMRAQSGERAPHGLRAELRAMLFHRMSEMPPEDLRRLGSVGPSGPGDVYGYRD